MHSDVVVVPCFDRPEYLYVCIEMIKLSDHHDEHLFLFALDKGFDADNMHIIEQSGLRYEVVCNNGTRYRHMKQSYNVLEAYRVACELSAKYVYLIEDDIFIAKSFFTMHRRAQAMNPFCSIAAHLQNAKHLHTLHPSTIGLTTESVYQSWGVCWNKEILQKYVLPHANGRYYREGGRYLAKRFPWHFLGRSYGEQDGLIRRVHDDSGKSIAFFDYPRAFHAGIWGYHRQGERVKGWDLEKKISFIKSTCFSHEKMQKYNEFNDVFISDLTV